MAADTPDQNLSQYFAVCNDFIHAARLREGNVLIHCLAGMSRSVTVAVAYIMTCTNLNWKESLKVVRAGRAVANPNMGFQTQLQEFEMFRLVDERRRLRERFPSSALEQLDRAKCMAALDNYEELLMNKDICEGNCTRGEKCPTGGSSTAQQSEVAAVSSNNDDERPSGSSGNSSAKQKSVAYTISFAVEQWKTLVTSHNLSKTEANVDNDAGTSSSSTALQMEEGGEEIMPNVVRYYPRTDNHKTESTSSSSTNDVKDKADSKHL